MLVLDGHGAVDAAGGIAAESGDVDEEAGVGVDPAGVDGVDGVEGAAAVVRVDFEEVLFSFVRTDGVGDVGVGRHVVVLREVVNGGLRDHDVEVVVPGQDAPVPPPA